MLGIELHTRRRNRMNGRVTACDARGFSIAVDQAFGNCPRFIQQRAWSATPDPAPSASGEATPQRHLDAAAREHIARADTFFVASAVRAEDATAPYAVDVSHRGGKPGFVRVDGDMLTIPDFAGNLFFNTLGNLLLNPRAGLLFVDFETGDLLQVTGTTEIVFDGDEVASFEGAERLWRLRVEGMVRRRGGLRLRWTVGAYSPDAVATGAWA